MLALLLALAALAAGWRAVHDTGTHAPEKLAKWGRFWDARTSWTRKYRGGLAQLGPRFPGSTTWLVALTDGWHLSNLLSWLAADVAVLVLAYGTPRLWPAVAYVVVRRVVFEPLYRWLRK